MSRAVIRRRPRPSKEAIEALGTREITKNTNTNAMELKIMDDIVGIEAIGALGTPLESMYMVMQVFVHVSSVYD